MSKLFIDDRAIEFMKKTLDKENARAVRIFTSGGCCRQFEIATVRKALAGDITYTQGGVTVHIEKGLADSNIEVRFDDKKGLLISFGQQENL